MFGIDRRRISKTEEEEKEVEQLKDFELADQINALERKKINYENILEEKNATTQLL